MPAIIHPDVIAESLLDTLAHIDELDQDCDDRIYRQGYSQDDTMDSRGEKLRPAFNKGGEPWWM